MVIDRRDFLKFIVGGAVGTIFTPLPWVSMDEVAKWTQRWAPVPEKGETSHLFSTCRLCPAGCGIRIRLIEAKRAVKIDGNPDHPVNRGGLCPLGLAGLQYLYGDGNRVPSPLRRAGMRGGGDWKPIPWEEALSFLSEQLQDLRRKGLSHTVAFLDGGGDGTLSFMVERFMTAYGSPNYIRTSRQKDLEAIVTRNLHGQPYRLGYDLPRSDYVLSFGVPLLEGWGNPCWAASALKVWRGEGTRKTRFVQIDTMATITASVADDWIAVQPETEGVLALGLARVMLEQGWVAAKGTAGEELQAFLKQRYPAERVSALTGVDSATLHRLAKEFAAARQPLALWGKGKGEPPVSLFQAQAVHLLNILVGSVNRPGGVYLQKPFSFASWGPTPLDETARKGLSRPRVDEARSASFPLTGNLENRFWTHAARKTFYPVNILFLHEVNPVFNGKSSQVLQALAGIPLLVSFSSFRDETSAYADLILPSPTFLERWDDCVGSPAVPFPVYGLTKPVLPPLFNGKPVGEILIQLSRMLGGNVGQAIPFENMERAVQQTARDLWGSKKGRIPVAGASEAGKEAPSPAGAFDAFWERLTHHGVWYDDEIVGEPAKVVGFSTLIRSASGERKGAQGNDKAYPYLLIPQSLLLLENGYWPNPPFLTKLLGEETLKGKDLVVQIHPRTARNLSLKEGDRIEIRSADGGIRARVHLFEGARPDCVFVPLGLGHQGFDATLQGRGDNPYPLLHREEDPLTGLETSWNTRITIRKI